MSDESESPLDKVWDMLCHHNKHGHTAEQTLNRLFSENLGKWRRDLYSTRPNLHKGNLKVREESWTVAELDKLERGHNRTVTKGPDDLPIIVVDYRGERRLIDGTTRINKWVAEDNEDRHTVCLIEVIEG